MSVGTLFYVIALVFFFLAGIGQAVLAWPTCVAWGLFSLTLGLLLSGVAIPLRRV